MSSGWMTQARLRARRAFGGGRRFRPVEGARAFLWRDFTDVWRQRELCTSLAYQRSTSRFSRTFLGPIWIVLSFVLTTYGIALLWSQIVGRPFAVFFPYVTLGFYVWNFIIGSMTEGARALLDNKGLALQTRTPMVMYPVVAVMKQGVNALYNLPYATLVAVLYAPPEWSVLLFIPGVLLLIVVMVGAAVTLSIWCAYVPDLAELIGASLRFIFFFTPIIWMPIQRAYFEAVWMFNPFYHLLNIVRGPLLQQEHILGSFAGAGVACVAAWVAAVVSYYSAAGAVAARL